MLIALAAFASAWQVQSWRFNAKEKNRVEQTLSDQRLAAAGAIRRADNVIEAQSAATRRMVVLRADADGSRAALISLSGAVEAAMRAAATSHNACLDRATTAGKLLNQCAAQYQDLGERADRHASDVRTLMEAWPK